MHRSLLELRQRLCAERQTRHGKLTQMETERSRIKDWLSSLVGQRFLCYVCQEAVPLSLLVFNDLCRHQVCRCCLAKVMFATDATHPYVCLLCSRGDTTDTIAAAPSVLATLSPGLATVVEYRAELVDGAGGEKRPPAVAYRVQLVDN